MTLNETGAKMCSELSEVLKNCQLKLVNRIPKKVRDWIETSKDPNHHFTYDQSKSFEEQNLMQETRTMISILYRKYLATPEDKKRFNEEDQEFYIQEKLKQYKALMEQESRWEE
mgnify:CR=1 FL=1